jgi:hypothetical protein
MNKIKDNGDKFNRICTVTLFDGCAAALGIAATGAVIAHSGKTVQFHQHSLHISSM